MSIVRSAHTGGIDGQMHVRVPVQQPDNMCIHPLSYVRASNQAAGLSGVGRLCVVRRIGETCFPHAREQIVFG